MNPFEHLPPRALTRRQMLRQMGTGLGVLGLTGVLQDARVLANPVSDGGSPLATGPLSPRSPLVRARAKRIIHIYLNGGPSQVDTFDPKPALL
ncbi:MAG: hypothetical protein RIS76_4485, partial [Verrucomicrobiota bacterium]